MIHGARILAGLSVVLAAFVRPGLAAPSAKETRSIPVILDTDIGGDIDDTWALALLLASPELDLKLVVTDSHNTEGKAKIVARLLERAGRTDVPVGIGVKRDDQVGAQKAWVADYDLKRYPGKVYTDGVQALINTIRKSPRPITVIAIGPVPNLAAALRRDPKIADSARLVVMGGSVDRKYGGKAGRCAEYNVAVDPKAAQVAYGAKWDVTMTPLDTAGVVQLKGAHYAHVRDADNPLARALMENYRIWAKKHKAHAAERQSSTLFDTVAVYLAFDQKLCQMRDIRLRVTDTGITEPDLAGKRTHVAMDWNDLDAFYDLLANRIAGYHPGGSR